MSSTGLMNREPIFWTSTTPGYNKPDRERWITVDGKKVLEKHPQRGHIGDYDERRIAPGERWMLVVRHDGHEIRMVLTNAAAHMDSATPWGQHQRAKARHFGWYNPGSCPCALIATGELNPELVVDESVRNGQPCKQGQYTVSNRCPHSVAEQKARRDRHNAIERERESAFRTKEDKILEAMQMQTDATRRQTEALSAAIQKPQPNGKKVE